MLRSSHILLIDFIAQIATGATLDADARGVKLIVSPVQEDVAVDADRLVQPMGAEANGGRLYARNIPGTGCAFTVDLPRSTVLPPVSVQP